MELRTNVPSSHLSFQFQFTSLTSMYQLINIFAMNDDGIINEWYSGDGSSWQPGQINTHKVRPSSASSLSTIWHRYEKCVNCPNTLLLVYQDSKNKFNLANSTQNGLIFSTMDANPIAGSGISLALSWKDDTTTGLRLYYQIASGHLCSQDWFDPPADSRAGMYFHCKCFHLLPDPE